MNILYITVDALRADHVHPEVMPRTREFFDESVEFTECVANGPGTPWSFPALLASRYSGSTDGFGIPESGDGHPTLAEVLSEHGYRTAGFTDNRFASSAYNYDRGMDSMYDTGATSKIKGVKQFFRENLDQGGLAFQSLLRVYHILDNVLVGASDRDSRFVRSEQLIDELLKWTDQPGDWFAWLHPMDVHAPYEAPPDYQRMYLDEPVSRVQSQKLARTAVHHPAEMEPSDWELQQALYKAECRYFDDQFKRLLDELSERGELQDTMIVFTADHGDMLGEHGKGGHPQEFWEEVIRVPLAVSSPQKSRGTYDRQVGVIDIPPTILELLEIESPSVWDGSSLWREDGDPVDEHVYVDVGAELDRNHGAIRGSDGWKLMRHQDSKHLFNLADDPTEATDMSSGNLDQHEKLSKKLNEHMDEMEQRRKRGTAGVEDEEMIKEHLNELGYIE